MQKKFCKEQFFYAISGIPQQSCYSFHPIVKCIMHFLVTYYSTNMKTFPVNTTFKLAKVN